MTEFPDPDLPIPQPQPTHPVDVPVPPVAPDPRAPTALEIASATLHPLPGHDVAAALPPARPSYITPADHAEIHKRFTYHPTKPDQVTRYTTLRNHAGSLAEHISNDCPPSRERALALTKLEEAIMWANAAIARNELP